MESLNNFNNMNQMRPNEAKIVPGSEEWLGGPEMEVTHTNEGLGKNSIEHLPTGIGFDGTRFEVPVPRNNILENTEIIEEAETIPEHLEKVAKIVLPVFIDSISRGATEGWDTTTNSPAEKFIEVEGASLEKIVRERATGWREDCTVYDILRNEPTPIQNDREIAVKNALIKRASRSCSH